MMNVFPFFLSFCVATAAVVVGFLTEIFLLLFVLFYAFFNFRGAFENFLLKTAKKTVSYKNVFIFFLIIIIVNGEHKKKKRFIVCFVVIIVV